MNDIDYNKRDKKRLFIGIDLPGNIKDYLFNLTFKLGKKSKIIRPVPAKNIHLTLKFLGDIDSGKIEKISRAIKNTALLKKPVNYCLGNKIEAFPNIAYARIMYVPVIRGGDAIRDFFISLENNLSKIKIKKENRRFVSHATIARLKKKIDISSLVKDIELDFIHGCSFNKVTLFESILRPTGMEYIIIDEYGLK